MIAVAAGERLSPGAGITLAAIAVGVALATVSPAETSARRLELRALLLAACGALSFGPGLYATGRIGQRLGIAWAVLPPRVVGVAMVALPLAFAGRWRMRRAAVPYVVAGGLGDVLGYASYAVGARHGLAVSAVLASQFAAISAAVGYLRFRERLARVQVAGIVTIVAGVSVLSALHG